MSDDREIVYDIWIAIEKLVAPAPNQNACEQKNDHCDGERDTQRREASLFNHRHHQGTICFHVKKLSLLSIGCSNASGGFSAATEGGITIPSSEIPQRHRLVAFGGEDRFWIGAGNFAHRNPANAADQRAN